jgi:outer membrane protein OmpA-like peptidoglycan-associated protein
MVALFVAMFTMNAQTVEHSKLFDNVSVTVLGGGVTTGQFVDVPTPFFWDGTKAVFNGVRPFMGLEFTKYVTPVVGFSVEGLGFVNTTTSDTFFDESAVLANGKLNLSNWFGGYKGQPRRVEVVAVAGLGWGHDYVNGNEQTWASIPAEDKVLVVGNNPYNSNAVLFTDKDYVVYNAGAELNFNLGEERAWQISVRPGVMWFNKYTAGNFQSLPTWKHDARANMQLGVTYKFGKAGHHNFRLCPYSVTKADYDALMAKYNELAGREPEVREVVKETVKTETVTKEVVAYRGVKTYITFAIGSAALTEVEREKVGLFAESLDNDTLIQIVGSADSGTGSETRNFALANNRANVVKNVLVNDYGIAANRITVSTKLDVTNNPKTSRCAVIAVDDVDVD